MNKNKLITHIEELVKNSKHFVNTDDEKFLKEIYWLAQRLALEIEKEIEIEK